LDLLNSEPLWANGWRFVRCFFDEANVTFRIHIVEHLKVLKRSNNYLKSPQHFISDPEQFSGISSSPGAILGFTCPFFLRLFRHHTQSDLSKLTQRTIGKGQWIE
jgi:hypothetical protein